MSRGSTLGAVDAEAEGAATAVVAAELEPSVTPTVELATGVCVADAVGEVGARVPSRSPHAMTRQKSEAQQSLVRRGRTGVELERGHRGSRM